MSNITSIEDIKLTKVDSPSCGFTLYRIAKSPSTGDGALTYYLARLDIEQDWGKSSFAITCATVEYAMQLTALLIIQYPDINISCIGNLIVIIHKNNEYTRGTAEIQTTNKVFDSVNVYHGIPDGERYPIFTFPFAQKYLYEKAQYISRIRSSMRKLNTGSVYIFIETLTKNSNSDTEPDFEAQLLPDILQPAMGSVLYRSVWFNNHNMPGNDGRRWLRLIIIELSLAPYDPKYEEITHIIGGDDTHIPTNTLLCSHNNSYRTFDIRKIHSKKRDDWSRSHVVRYDENIMHFLDKGYELKLKIISRKHFINSMLNTTI